MLRADDLFEKGWNLDSAEARHTIIKSIATTGMPLADIGRVVGLGRQAVHETLRKKYPDIHATWNENHGGWMTRRKARKLEKKRMERYGVPSSLTAPTYAERLALDYFGRVRSTKYKFGKLVQVFDMYRAGLTIENPPSLRDFQNATRIPPATLRRILQVSDLEPFRDPGERASRLPYETWERRALVNAATAPIPDDDVGSILGIPQAHEFYDRFRFKRKTTPAPVATYGMASNVYHMVDSKIDATQCAEDLGLSIDVVEELLARREKLASPIQHTIELAVAHKVRSPYLRPSHVFELQAA
ncbi:MAG: hypothetical protein OXR66_06255 [Candidatus Woesearchaeota archaeon]|nr:hypothetical protein [Candidatus Woesearchaeota archaeon]